MVKWFYGCRYSNHLAMKQFNHLIFQTKKMKRRNFIKSSAVASSALMMPGFLSAYTGNNLTSSRSGKILVVIQLSGGNDGLNTIIPFEDDIYYRERPMISIPKNEVLKVGSEMGFHPELAPLRDLYNAGQMTIINSVGYPNPTRSHFRSMDIWQTGSGSEDYWSTGWLGRYLDSHCQGRPAHHALEVDEGLSLAMRGLHKSGFAMSDARSVKNATANRFLNKASKTNFSSESNLSYLYKTLVKTQESADYLFEKSKVHTSKTTFPNGKFAQDLKQIAELITADTATQVYYVSLGGFDTHAQQRGRQKRLLKTYAEAVKAFTDDLKSNNLFDDTLIMTFSEFGRRVKQNASGGTDHGTANNVFLMGGKLKKPAFFNAAPDLTNLQNQDLVYDIDFRQIYSTILDRWLAADSGVVLKKEFSLLGFV